jgi:hypothetical protein
LREAVIGAKIETLPLPKDHHSKMIFLKDLPQQWPWSGEDLPSSWEDKELLSIHIGPEEDEAERRIWRIPLYAPMPGYAFVGVRLVLESEQPYETSSRITVGERDKSFLGSPWDRMVLRNREWIPLPFPLTNRMIAVDEDGLFLLIQHKEPLHGKVEVLAQRFHDILEQETNYAFWDDQKNSVLSIMTKSGYFYKPRKEEEAAFPQMIKLIPPISILLQGLWKEEAPFQNNLPYENTVAY